MFETKFAWKIRKNILFSVTFFFPPKIIPWDNVEKYGGARQAADDNIRQTHVQNIQYLLLFPPQQWLRERPSMLPYTTLSVLSLHDIRPTSSFFALINIQPDVDGESVFSHCLSLTLLARYFGISHKHIFTLSQLTMRICNIIFLVEPRLLILYTNYITDRTTEYSLFDTSQMQDIFPSVMASRSALKPTSLPLIRYRGLFSPSQIAETLIGSLTSV